MMVPNSKEGEIIRRIQFEWKLNLEIKMNKKFLLQKLKW